MTLLIISNIITAALLFKCYSLFRMANDDLINLQIELEDSQEDFRVFRKITNKYKDDAENDLLEYMSEHLEEELNGK